MSIFSKIVEAIKTDKFYRDVAIPTAVAATMARAKFINYSGEKYPVGDSTDVSLSQADLRVRFRIGSKLPVTGGNGIDPELVETEPLVDFTTTIFPILEKCRVG